MYTSVLLLLQVSDLIRGDDNSDHAESLSLQKALYITCFASAIGSACFLVTTFYIHHDEHQVQLYIEQHDNKQQDNDQDGDQDDGQDDQDDGQDIEDKEPLLLNNDKSSVDVNYSVNN